MIWLRARKQSCSTSTAASRSPAFSPAGRGSRGTLTRERVEQLSMDNRGQLSPQCCRKALRAAGVYQLQRVGLEDALDLVAGVDGPGARGVELDIDLPVLQGLAGLANFFVGES